VAVDLIGPMLLSARGNTWILMLMDHFTRWADALAILDATAPTVAWPWTKMCSVTSDYPSRYIRTRVPSSRLWETSAGYGEWGMGSDHPISLARK